MTPSLSSQNFDSPQLSREPDPFDAVSVLGAGAWGTALADLLSRQGRQVVIWAHEAETVTAINEAGENKAFLPGVALHSSMRATAALEEAAQADAVLFVAPAQFARPVLTAFAKHAKPEMPVALCSKGIERDTHCLMTEVLAQVMPDAVPAVVSGPSFAADVARGLPTAVTLASAHPEQAAQWAATIGSSHFRPYLSDDLIGAEIGGAAKNVLAIACGVAEGRGLGESARAALITRGFAELTRLGRAMGARAETLTGLCGLGDLVLTCSSLKSRNMSLGAALGEGQQLSDILAKRSSVAEGAASAQAVASLAQKFNVDMPICAAVAALIAGETDVDQAMSDLLSRPIRAEL